MVGTHNVYHRIGRCLIVHLLRMTVPYSVTDVLWAQYEGIRTLEPHILKYLCSPPPQCTEALYRRPDSVPPTTHTLGRKFL